jgi:segregation and condensation protein A
MALDANPESPGSNGDEEKNLEPIYPMGPALKVSPDSVQLTFLDLEAVPAPALGPDSDVEDVLEHPGLEIKTPLGVRIPVFEGPLDLLLHLIRRDKVDIYDIPIAPITEQYLGMLGLMQVLDLDLAGDFLVMAATLMRIKARMLLPTWPEDEEEEDPRAELVRQLLEYRQFKEAAQNLKIREEERRLLFGRGFVPEFEDDIPVELEPISHFVLIDVMKEVLSRVGEEFFYEVELEDVTLEEKSEMILAELKEKGRLLFVDLMTRYPRRLHIVVSFMAILELSKLGRIALAQEATFGQIWLYPVVDGRVVTEAAEEGAPLPDPNAGQGMTDDSEPEAETPGAVEGEHGTP